nr:MAG TPA: Large Terminase [Siphoviridae sp. ctBho3]
MIENRAYLYCKKAVKENTTPKFVKLQMKDFMRICEGKDKKYKISEKKLKQLNGLLKLLNMPKGLKAGVPLAECTCGYQWLFYIAIFCVVYRENEEKRRYETGLLEISRKNFKTFTVATIFILLLLTEPQFSKFFSVAPDGSLSREIREAIAEMLRSSPLVYSYKGVNRFKILRDYISFKPFNSVYTPLSFSTSRMDGRLPNAFCADEVGALPTIYPLEAMRSGQLNILNKLGFVISTKYPTIDNPFEAEVSYSKKVLNSLVTDETRFSLLYEPDNPKDWETDDLILKQANPVALEIPEIWEDLLKKRTRAIATASVRENFVTKHCNIIYQGVGTESYIDVKDVQACRTESIDWRGKEVYLGLDLSESNDNTSVSMVCIDTEGKLYAKSFAFIPEDRIEEKSQAERVDYRNLCKTEHVFSCGDRVIDYTFVEDFILSLPEKYGVEIQEIGFDRWNALSTAQKLEKEGFPMIELKQHSSVLHPATKYLKEKILKKEFAYETNSLLEINFQNAKCVYDTNKNQYVNKKKSNGKVDMVVSLINAVCLLQRSSLVSDFVVQVI